MNQTQKHYKMIAKILVVFALAYAVHAIELGHASSYSSINLQTPLASYQHAAPVIQSYAAPVHAYSAPQLHSYAAPVHSYAAPAILKTVQSHEEYAHPQYQFKYGVEDHHTGDIKNQQEQRDGDVVKGAYSLLQPDGVTRTVHYSADHHNGFNAQVSYSGHAGHPQQIHKAVVAAPVYSHSPVYSNYH